MTVVLTESLAQKYFNDEDPINKVIKLEFARGLIFNLKVISVIEDIPANSHFHTNIFISLVSADKYYNDKHWFNNNYSTYISLIEGASYIELEKKLPDFVDKYMCQGYVGITYEELSAKGDKWELYFQPLTDIHLNSDLSGDL